MHAVTRVFLSASLKIQIYQRINFIQRILRKTKNNYNVQHHTTYVLIQHTTYDNLITFIVATNCQFNNVPHIFF